MMALKSSAQKWHDHYPLQLVEFSKLMATFDINGQEYIIHSVGKSSEYFHNDVVYFSHFWTQTFASEMMSVLFEKKKCNLPHLSAQT